jgi:hypothetical protein
MKITTEWDRSSKNITDFTKQSKNLTDFAKPSKITIDYKKSDAFDSAVKLSSLIVKLSSLTVTLIGGISGSFLDQNKEVTDFTKVTKPTTDWSKI